MITQENKKKKEKKKKKKREKKKKKKEKQTLYNVFQHQSKVSYSIPKVC